MKRFREYINEKTNLDLEEKDIKRLLSMEAKSKGDKNKIIQFAINMAKAIKSPEKAYRRGKAAFEVLGKEGKEIARIFWDRANALGYYISDDEFALVETEKAQFLSNEDMLHFAGYSDENQWEEKHNEEFSIESLFLNDIDVFENI